MSEKSDQTERDFAEAFWILYADRSVERITIHELYDQAGYTRGTFYLHYRDIYDLLEREESALLEEMASTKKRTAMAVPITMDTRTRYALVQKSGSSVVAYLQNTGKVAWGVGSTGESRMMAVRYQPMTMKTMANR